MGQLAQYFDTGNMKQDQKLTEKGKRSPVSQSRRAYHVRLDTYKHYC